MWPQKGPFSNVSAASLVSCSAVNHLLKAMFVSLPHE
jgi:hypothetical protein